MLKGYKKNIVWSQCTNVLNLKFYGCHFTLCAIFKEEEKHATRSEIESFVALTNRHSSCEKYINSLNVEHRTLSQKRVCTTQKSHSDAFYFGKMRQYIEKTLTKAERQHHPQKPWILSLRLINKSRSMIKFVCARASMDVIENFTSSQWNELYYTQEHAFKKKKYKSFLLLNVKMIPKQGVWMLGGCLQNFPQKLFENKRVHCGKLFSW